jgi:hypothetical protein
MNTHSLTTPPRRTHSIEAKFESDHAEMLYGRMMEIRRQISKWQTSSQNIHVSVGQLRAAIAEIDEAIGRENRNEILSKAYRRDITSSKELTDAEAFGLVIWVGMAKDNDNPSRNVKWHPCKQFVSDIPVLQEWYGQIRFY